MQPFQVVQPFQVADGKSEFPCFPGQLLQLLGTSSPPRLPLPCSAWKLPRVQDAESITGGGSGESPPMGLLGACFLRGLLCQAGLDSSPTPQREEERARKGDVVLEVVVVDSGLLALPLVR